MFGASRRPFCRGRGRGQVERRGTGRWSGAAAMTPWQCMFPRRAFRPVGVGRPRRARHPHLVGIGLSRRRGVVPDVVTTGVPPRRFGATVSGPVAVAGGRRPRRRWGSRSGWQTGRNGDCAGRERLLRSERGGRARGICVPGGRRAGMATALARGICKAREVFGPGGGRPEPFAVSGPAAAAASAGRGPSDEGRGERRAASGERRLWRSGGRSARRSFPWRRATSTSATRRGKEVRQGSMRGRCFAATSL